MIVFPIIPIWIMTIICALLIVISVKNRKSRIRRCIIVVLLFFINLRIMFVSDDSNIYNINLDVLFVIDNTISMAAEDYEGKATRLDAVKNDCTYISERLQGARFSIITFSNESKVIIPFTRDINMTLQAINTLQVTNKLYAKGSTPGVAFNDMREVLKFSRNNSKNKQVVFFISDGEVTSEEGIGDFSELKKYIDYGFVLGYGTEKRWIYESWKFLWK